jgi:hypothetical protein
MTRCSPEYTFTCEMDLACTYSLSRPKLARECVLTALEVAIAAGRPDLAYAANSFLGVL